MPGPATPAEAITWAQEALRRGRYWILDHADLRSRTRRITFDDIKNVIERAESCNAYAHGKTSREGTCWRIHGRDLDDLETSIGVEISRDHLGGHVLVISVF